MLETEYDDILKYCLDKFGIESQLDQAQEEAAEFITARNHFRRCQDNSFLSMIEEAADTWILMNQIRIYYPKDFEKMLRQKIEKIKKVLL